MNTLEQSIENLYDIFSIYPLREHIDGCPCCVSEENKHLIHSKSLKDLEAEDLSRYTFKALTTWGNIEDFKHFLPRIFQIMIDGKSFVLSSTILGKLEYGNWKDWPESEKDAVKNCLLQWWRKIIETQPYFNHDAFIGIYRLTKNLDELLQNWETDVPTNGFKVFVDCIDNYYDDLADGRKKFKDLEEKDIEKMLDWIGMNSEVLEQGFFYFEDKDKKMADIISTALYIYEHSKK